MTTIESHPDALEGSVTHLDYYDVLTFSTTDAILCRVNAPLVSLAFGFIRRNIGVRILGREIGAGLVTLIGKMKAQNPDDLDLKLHSWCQREVAKAFSRGHESAVSAIEDKVACIQVFIDNLEEGNRTLSELTRRIESLFSDNNKGLLTLCSVHKAKGLEWPTVFILDKGKYMPSKYAVQPWQRKQEQNLIYVAVTRAKLNLVYIESGKWRTIEREKEC